MARVIYGVWDDTVRDNRGKNLFELPHERGFDIFDAFNQGNPIKAFFGSRGFFVFEPGVSLLDGLRQYIERSAAESCGKCTPCREGTDWLEKILERILHGHGRPDDLELLLDVCDNISPGLAWPPRQTTICPLGPSAVSPIHSAVVRFRDEFEAYIAKAEPPAIATVGGSVPVDIRVGASS